MRMLDPPFAFVPDAEDDLQNPTAMGGISCVSVSFLKLIVRSATRCLLLTWVATRTTLIGTMVVQLQEARRRQCGGRFEQCCCVPQFHNSHGSTNNANYCRSRTQEPANIGFYCWV